MRPTISPGLALHRRKTRSDYANLEKYLEMGAVMWEYLVVRLHINKPDHAEKTLNDWGRDGWELVSVCWQIGWSTAYFKRPKTLRDDEV
jgi:hypothetical protein